MKERYYVLQGLVIGVGLILCTRLFVIQVSRTDYQSAAEENIVRKITEYPYRGLMYDTHGSLLVYNVPIYDLKVVPKGLKHLDTVRFCSLIPMDAQMLKERLRTARAFSLEQPSVVLAQLSAEEYAVAQSNLMFFPNFFVSVRTARAYTQKGMAHILGYMGEVSQLDLAQDTIGYYTQGNLRGISGIEATYEATLRGSPGHSYQMVDAKGRIKAPFQERQFDHPSTPGQSLLLTIDAPLQAYAEDLLNEFAGSIVAIEPQTGGILALVSKPDYDPKQLSHRNFKQNYRALIQDSLKPLFNRALMAQYRPGSIFKIAQALIGLQEGVIDTTSAMPCHAFLIGCHAHKKVQNLQDAIAYSCNPYFYRTMERIIYKELSNNAFEAAREGLELWGNYMHAFGFGQTLGIDLPYEIGGFVPNVEYYDRIYGPLHWTYKTIYSLSIGEGENLVIPLQMANFASLIANKGFYYSPHIVRQVENQPPIERKRYESPIDSKYFNYIHQAMKAVVQQGTGWRAKIEDIAVCGKTGTVENSNKKEHAVFIGFAPADAPQIALSVYVESAGFGGNVAAAIAGLLMEKHLRGDEAKLRMEPYIRQIKQPPPPLESDPTPTPTPQWYPLDTLSL